MVTQMTAVNENMTFRNTFMPPNDTDWTTQVSNVTDPTPTWSILEKAVFGTWLSISMLCAIIGNFMVIVVVIRHKGMQTRTNMFLVNLAVADFLVGILLAPFSLVTIITDDWIFGDAMCNINGFLNNVCFITSIHTLMYISIHKYVSITRPFSRILNHRKILLMSIAAWLWSFICAILTMFVLSKVVYKHAAMQCGPEYPKNKLEYLHHVIISATNILIPLIVMSFAYARMYYEFRKHAMRLQKNTTLQSDQILGQQIQVTKTLFLVLACFVVCWLPYGVYSTYVSMIKDKSKILVWSNPAAYCFMYMNSGCNPIIYAWRSPSFREGYKQILCQKSSYIVSDDTIKEVDSPSIIRRLSALIHSSFRSSGRMMSQRNSDTSSQNSPRMSRGSVSLSSPSHTLLKRACSKTAKGSSIIKKDGSVIITKNGKIVTVRPDREVRRDRSFSGFEDLKVRHENGVTKSLSELNMNDKIELTPLLHHSLQVKGVNGAGNVRISPTRMQFSHSSLTKIDSVDENELESHQMGNRLRIPSRLDRQISQSSDAVSGYPGAVTQPAISQSERSNSPSVSIKSDLDDVFVQSPEKLGPMYHSQDGLLDSMPLQPVLKDSVSKARSENNLDSAENVSHKTKSKVTNSSKNIAYKVPMLRCPSVEKLDVAASIPRCSSDASSVRRLMPRSPLFVRRWLSNKLIDQSSKVKM